MGYLSGFVNFFSRPICRGRYHRFLLYAIFFQVTHKTQIYDLYSFFLASLLTYFNKGTTVHQLKLFIFDFESLDFCDFGLHKTKKQRAIFK